jgi:hypothetical protein
MLTSYHITRAFSFQALRTEIRVEIFISSFLNLRICQHDRKNIRNSRRKFLLFTHKGAFETGTGDKNYLRNFL